MRVDMFRRPARPMVPQPGPTVKVAAVLSQWLASIDGGESTFNETQDK
jgi:hypothetical protein